MDEYVMNKLIKIKVDGVDRGCVNVKRCWPDAIERRARGKREAGESKQRRPIHETVM